MIFLASVKLTKFLAQIPFEIAITSKAFASIVTLQETPLTIQASAHQAALIAYPTVCILADKHLNLLYGGDLRPDPLFALFLPQFAHLAGLQVGMQG